ncbi:hypothetical protein Bca101_082423 [Brassica carinata]
MHINSSLRHKPSSSSSSSSSSDLSLSLINIRVLEFLMEKEECSSSESGWTTYISSPIKVDEDDVADEGYYEGYNIYNYYRKGENEEEKNKDSDDSMASDASSGPSYQRYHQKNNKSGRREACNLKNGKSEDTRVSKGVQKCPDECARLKPSPGGT